MIERGRLLAELSRASEADADFAHAVQIAPDNLQLFLNAGWWVAGPYPKDLKSPALESDPAANPSQPPPASGGEPRYWRSVLTETLGFVDLGKPFNAENIAAYAMSMVYSATNRDVVFLIGTDDAGCVWLNGRLLFDSPVFTAADSSAVIATLEAGRNSIVAKVANDTGPHSLNLRISDAPADFTRGYARSGKSAQAADACRKALALEPGNSDPRFLEAGAQAFFELGRWKEAAAVQERVVALDAASWGKQMYLSYCYLAGGDLKAYRRLCEETLKRYGKDRDLVHKDRFLANNVVSQATLIPDAVRDYSELLEIGRKLVDKNEPGGNNFNTYGSILYRARRYKPALTFLQKSIDAQKGTGNAHDWVFTAMARHKSRQPGASEALERARSLAKGVGGWRGVELRALLAEAEMQLDLPPPP